MLCVFLLFVAKWKREGVAGGARPAAAPVRSAGAEDAAHAAPFHGLQHDHLQGAAADRRPAERSRREPGWPPCYRVCPRMFSRGRAL